MLVVWPPFPSSPEPFPITSFPTSHLWDDQYTHKRGPTFISCPYFIWPFSSLLLLPVGWPLFLVASDPDNLEEGVPLSEGGAVRFYSQLLRSVPLSSRCFWLPSPISQASLCCLGEQTPKSQWLDRERFISCSRKPWQFPRAFSLLTLTRR